MVYKPKTTYTGKKINRKRQIGRMGKEWNGKTTIVLGRRTKKWNEKKWIILGRRTKKWNEKKWIMRNLIKGQSLKQADAHFLDILVTEIVGLSLEKKRAVLLKQDAPSLYIKHRQDEAEKVGMIRENYQRLVPVEEFVRADLPQCYQHDPEMFNLILSLANLTVKIEVTGASGKWNNFWSEIKSPNMSQICPVMSSDILMASGKIHDMFIHTENDGPNPCLCKKCKSHPEKEWAEILIITTAQVLYDHDDASHFSASFSIDGRPINLQGTRIVSRSIEKDLCKFMCVTCDVESLRTLEDKLNLFEECWAKACRKYAKTVKWEEEKLVVIVSHPYGQKMHISLGKKMTEIENKRITYDVPTYPGCSGAYILIPDFDVIDEFLPFSQ